MRVTSYFEKTVFVLSVAIIGIGYGIAANQWGLFPSQFAQKAFNQAQVAFGIDSPSSRGGKVYNREGANPVHPESMQRGLTLITSTLQQTRSQPKLELIDRRGKVLHEWVIDRKELFGGEELRGKDPEKSNVHGSLLLPGGDVLINLRFIGMARLDACGNVKWTLKEGNHHSIARAEDGSFWSPGVSAERRSDSRQYSEGYPGLDHPVWLDRILKVSRNGSILRDITVLDVLYQNDLERYIAKEGVFSGNDPTHMNDVEPLAPDMAEEYPLFEAGDLLVSLRNINLVFVMNPQSGKVKWHASDPFIAQHDPDFTGDGWIGVFDNNRDGTERGTMLGGSRIVSMQPHTDSMRIRFPTDYSDPFYTPIRGKWQELENGNLLLTESEAGRVVEVDPKGRTVWEWIEPFDTVTKATRYNLTREEIASWPCSSVDPSDSSSKTQ